MKIRFNEDKEVVEAVKAGLQKSGGYCQLRFELPKEAVDARKSTICHASLDAVCRCLYW